MLGFGIATASGAWRAVHRALAQIPKQEADELPDARGPGAAGAVDVANGVMERVDRQMVDVTPEPAPLLLDHKRQ